MFRRVEYVKKNRSKISKQKGYENKSFFGSHTFCCELTNIYVMKKIRFQHMKAEPFELKFLSSLNFIKSYMISAIYRPVSSDSILE